MINEQLLEVPKKHSCKGVGIETTNYNCRMLSGSTPAREWVLKPKTVSSFAGVVKHSCKGVGIETMQSLRALIDEKHSCKGVSIEI